MKRSRPCTPRSSLSETKTSITIDTQEERCVWVWGCVRIMYGGCVWTYGVCVCAHVLCVGRVLVWCVCMCASAVVTCVCGIWVCGVYLWVFVYFSRDYQFVYHVIAENFHKVKISHFFVI